MLSGVLKRAPEMLAPVAVVYAQRLSQFGTRPRGVFWKTEEGQRLRFEVLLGAIDADAVGVTVNDLGCGYGALFEFIGDLPAMRGGRYFGYDICEDMVETSRRTIVDGRVWFGQSMTASMDADYSFASGTYNMRIDADEDRWMEYVKASLVHLWSRTRRAMAFNMLSTYGAKRLADLYYADPGPYFDFCMQSLARNVTLLHDYPLPEWTIMVRR